MNFLSSINAKVLKYFNNTLKNRDSVTLIYQSIIIFSIIIIYMSMVGWYFAIQKNACDSNECPYLAMESRSTVEPKPLALHLEKDQQLQKEWLINRAPGLESDEQAVVHLLENWGTFMDEGGLSPQWRKHIVAHTPNIMSNLTDITNCRDRRTVGMLGGPWDEHKSHLATSLLRECGYVYIENFFPRSVLSELSTHANAFAASPDAQRHFAASAGLGFGHERFVLPFQPPFNTSSVHMDERMHAVLLELLQGRFKLESATLAMSSAGSGHDSWYQGVDYLFHPEERLPAYAVVASIPLVDVTEKMGPMQFCPRKKLRFYQGYACNGRGFSMSTKLGDLVLYDYKTLRRVVGNRGQRTKSELNFLFSKPFFLHNEKYVSRDISLVATVHQRRYMETLFRHASN